jgi:hypothetical protein
MATTALCFSRAIEIASMPCRRLVYTRGRRRWSSDGLHRHPDFLCESSAQKKFIEHRRSACMHCRQFSRVSARRQFNRSAVTQLQVHEDGSIVRTAAIFRGANDNSPLSTCFPISCGQSPQRQRCFWCVAKLPC